MRATRAAPAANLRSVAIEINDSAPGGRDRRSRCERTIAALAARQHGVISAGQLVALGLSRKAIRGRLEAGRLHAVHAEVYAVGRLAEGDHGRWLAAVLAGGAGAVLSHRSAAELWGLLPRTGRTPDVSVRRGRRARPAVRFHRPRPLDRDDVTVRDRIPVTSPDRTLLDLAAILSAGQLERAFDEADRLHLLDHGRLRILRSRRGQRGVRKFRRLADRLLPAAAVTRSALEYRFLKLCCDRGLPRPEVNVGLAGFEVDVLWRVERLVVELDGHAFHGDRAAFERDRARDATLQADGYRVIRVTHRRLEDEPVAVLATVARLLSQPPGG